jgi:hypothetical protein
MDVDTPTRRRLSNLRGRGFVVAVLWRANRSGSYRLVVTPGSALTEEDRRTLKEHREALLDLLVSEIDSPWVDCPLGWPHDSPAWNGGGFGWTPMTRRDNGFTPEEEASS